MLTWLMIFVLPGALVFGGLAMWWRGRLARPLHMLFALPIASVVWLASMIFGWFLYLDVMDAGPLGRAANAGMVYSLLPALLAFWLLRAPSD